MNAHHRHRPNQPPARQGVPFPYGIDPFAYLSCAFAGLGWIFMVPGVFGPLAVALAVATLSRGRRLDAMTRWFAIIGLFSGAMATLAGIMAVVVFLGRLSSVG